MTDGATGGNSVEDLAARLALCLQHARPEAVFNLECFLNAHDKEMGGTLVIEGQSKRRKRNVPEIRYAAEGFIVSAGVSQIEFL